MKKITINEVELLYDISSEGRLTLKTGRGNPFIFIESKPEVAIKVIRAMLELAVRAKLNSKNIASR